MSQQSVCRALIYFMVCTMVSCAPAPSVTFRVGPTEDKEGLIKFYLTGTDITLSRKPAAGQTRDTVGLENATPIIADPNDPIGALLEAEVKVVLSPKEDRRTLYAAVPESAWLGAVQTNLSVTYFDTTDTSFLIKTIGSEVQDDRAKIISAIGAVTMAAVAVAYAPNQKVVLKLPVVIDSIEAKDGEWRGLPKNAGWFYKFVLSPETGASVGRDKFFSEFKNSETSAFPVSSCRRANLHLKYQGNNTTPNKTMEGDAKFFLTFGDPDFVDTFALPAKGSIKVHSICGADIVTDKASTSTTWDLVESLMNQVKNVKDKLK